MEETKTENQEVKKKSWLDVYFEKLESAGVSKESCDMMREKYGEQLRVASYSTKNDLGQAYDGSLLQVVMKKFTVFALNLNLIYPAEIRATKEEIVKVCLLQHISKAVRTFKSEDVWRIQKLGEQYVYCEDIPAIGTGLHSLQMATECGISFTPSEVEAMVINDRAEDGTQRFHKGVLTHIVQTALEMTYMEAKEMKKYNKKQAEVEAKKQQEVQEAEKEETSEKTEE